MRFILVSMITFSIAHLALFTESNTFYQRFILNLTIKLSGKITAL